MCIKHGLKQEYESVASENAVNQVVNTMETKAKFFLLLCCLTIVGCMAKDSWLRPGCHKVGNTRKISIPECVEFSITTNACRGFCESYAVPSVPFTSSNGLLRAPKPVVSVGQCCNMMKSEEIQRRVLCFDGFRNVTFKSAVSCSCYHCKKD